MYISKSIINLDRQKKRLSFLFTLIVFFVIFILELVFQSFKYYYYYSDIYNTLNSQIDNFISSSLFRTSKWFNNIKYNFWFRTFFEKWDILVVNPFDQKVVFSSINDYIFNRDFYKKLEEIWNFDLLKEVNLQWVKYVVVMEKSKTNYDDIVIYSYIRSTYSNFDFFKELFNFLIFLSVLSLWLYYLWYLFISFLFRPVEDNLKDMEDFIHNAWHELKTPIAVISSSLQLANATHNYEEPIRDSLEELKRMNDLINWLVRLSEITPNVKNTYIDWWKEINDIIKEYSYKLKDKDISISVKQNSYMKVHCNKDYFHILFSNLLNNSIKYTNPWWNIYIEINYNLFKIRDNWIWINKENLKKVFDRFFQDSDVRTWEWFGIWLSLVKKIADIYNWKINIDSEKWKRTEVIVKI